MALDGRSISLWDEETDELFDMLKTAGSPVTTPTPGAALLSNSSGRNGPLRSESLFPASPLTDTTTPVSRVLSGGPVLGPLRLASLAKDDGDDDLDLDSIENETIRIWPENKPRAVFSSDLKVTTAAPTLVTTTDADRSRPNGKRSSNREGDAADDETVPVLQPTSSLLTPFVFSFEEVFTGGDWYSRLRRKALAGELGTTQFSFRAIAWRLFLGVFDRSKSPADWLAQAAQQRQHYTELLAKHYVVDPQSHSDDDPLSQNESSVWKKYFQNSQLENTINTDIPRTYPENDFFQSSVVQKQMLRPLFLWSVLNPRTSYRQGMHEILAPMLYLLHRHSVETPDDSDIAGQLSHRKFVEHDSYWMFSAVMEHAATWFNNNSVSSPTVSDDLSSSSSSSASPPISTVVAKCKHIQEVLLKKFDPQLSGFLNDLEITPHLYGIRWVRILLGREFHLEDILGVWDALFSYDASLGLLDFICVAMLMFIRENLLQLDYNGAMKRLFKFPPVENATIFIERAIDLKEGKLHSAQAPPPSAPIVLEPNDHGDPLSSASVTSPTTTSSSSSSSSATASATGPAARGTVEGKTGTGKRILQFVSGAKGSQHAAPSAQAPAVDLSAKVATLESEVETLKTTQRHMASRLERIAFVLQQELSKPPDQMEMDLLILALAELKQVKDIGYGEIIVAQALDIFQGSVTFPAPQIK